MEKMSPEVILGLGAGMPQGKLLVLNGSGTSNDARHGAFLDKGIKLLILCHACIASKNGTQDLQCGESAGNSISLHWAT
jgi:hypothetical protein